jgi:hypothetical protein
MCNGSHIVDLDIDHREHDLEPSWLWCSSRAAALGFADRSDLGDLYGHCDCRRLPDHHADSNHGGDIDRVNAHHGNGTDGRQGNRLQHRHCAYGSGHHSSAASQHRGDCDHWRGHAVREFDGEIVVDEGGFVTLCALGAAAAASGHTSG